MMTLYATGEYGGIFEKKVDLYGLTNPSLKTSQTSLTPKITFIG